MGKEVVVTVLLVLVLRPEAGGLGLLHRIIPADAGKLVHALPDSCCLPA